MDEVHENCGVAAVSIDERSREKGKAPYYLYRLLLNLQNRGQLSAGITTYNRERNQLIDTHRNLGTVNEVFKTSYPILSQKLFEKYAGSKGIGHTRYATCGKDNKAYAQPFERHHGRIWKWFSFCFNGNLANYAELRDGLLKKPDYHILYDTDTEIIMHYLGRELKGSSKPNLVNVFRNLSKIFDGCYCLAFLNASGDLAVIRDPNGWRPMCYGRKDGIFMAASETTALLNSGVTNIKSLRPGEIVIVENGKVSVSQFARSEKKSFCMFEWVYFANVSSIFEGKSVYLTRTNLGRELAKKETLRIDDQFLVVPVPDSAKPAGDAYAFELGIPSREGLVRNRYVGRTFIESGCRQDKVKNKFTVLREIVKGKKVLLVDDSIVRGTTTREIVQYIRDIGGAKEVHVRVSCPPILSPCFYGIDMSTITELFACKYFAPPYHKIPDSVLRKMARELGADSVVYQDIEGLIKSIGIPRQSLCLACLNAEYPTEWGKKIYKKALSACNACADKRSYE
ncbi:MAG: amidophosphoribosyltransferase [archaeon]